VFIASSGFVTTLGAVHLFLPDLLPALSRESALTTEGISQRLRYVLNIEPKNPMSEVLTLSQLDQLDTSKKLGVGGTVMGIEIDGSISEDTSNVIDPTKQLSSDQLNQLSDFLEKRNDSVKKADALKYQELLKINKELTQALEEKNKSSSWLPW
jgi:hypothetical protein